MGWEDQRWTGKKRTRRFWNRPVRRPWLILGAAMLALAVEVYRRRERGEALRATRRLFAFSIFYLFALFATLLIEVVARAVVPSIW